MRATSLCLVVTWHSEVYSNLGGDATTITSTLTSAGGRSLPSPTMNVHFVVKPPCLPTVVRRRSVELLVPICLRNVTHGLLASPSCVFGWLEKASVAVSVLTDVKPGQIHIFHRVEHLFVECLHIRWMATGKVNQSFNLLYSNVAQIYTL